MSMIITFDEKYFDLAKAPVFMDNENTVRIRDFTVSWAKFYDRCDDFGIGASVDFKGSDTAQGCKVICAQRANLSS